MPSDASGKSVDELRALGNTKFRALNYGAALMCYTQAIDKDPQSFALYYNRAVTLVKMDAIDEAKEDLLRSLEINADYIPSLCLIAFLYLYQGNPPDSLESYVRVVRISETLPNQLNRFKAQLREAIRLAESRCKQQEYSEAFINNILPSDIRSIVETYPNLPTHMVESGIPPVAFGNVPIAQHVNQGAPIIASANIPIPIPSFRVASPTTNTTAVPTTDTAPAFGTTQATSNNRTGTNAQPMGSPPGVIDDFVSLLNVPEMFGSAENNGNRGGGPVITRTVHVNPSTAPPLYTPAVATTGTSNTNASTATIIHPPITRSTINTINPIQGAPGLPIDLLQAHREAHNQALNRAAELRRQREATQTASTSTPAPAPAAPVAPAPAPAAPSLSGSDFARHLANTIVTQVNQASSNPLSDGQLGNGNGDDGTPSAIRSFTQNLTNIATGVFGGIVNNNNHSSDDDARGFSQLDHNLVDDLD